MTQKPTQKLTQTILMVGTRKGLWIGRSDDRLSWRWSGPHFDLMDVYAVMIDRRGGRTRLLAAPASEWTGPQLFASDDLGETWTELAAPCFPDDTGASLRRIWQLTPGIDDDTVYAGTEPGAVFVSRDLGAGFELVRGLWDHPHRTEWGAGYGGQTFHTILPHPADRDSILAAISSGGCYRSADAGASWAPYNQGIRAEFLPEGAQYPEFGQCTHKIARHPSRPERLFLQNHGGVYRSDDEGGQWREIHAGLPVNFGFPIVVHPHEPDTVFVFPLNGSEGRYPYQAQARVYRSRDAGDSWEPLGEGLPDGFYVGVMRDAMVSDDHDPLGLYLGARNGTVWSSADEGASWQQSIANLPDVMCVRAAQVSTQDPAEL